MVAYRVLQRLYTTWKTRRTEWSHKSIKLLATLVSIPAYKQARSSPNLPSMIYTHRKHRLPMGVKNKLIVLTPTIAMYSEPRARRHGYHVIFLQWPQSGTGKTRNGNWGNRKWEMEARNGKRRYTERLRPHPSLLTNKDQDECEADMHWTARGKQMLRNHNKLFV